MYSFISSVLFLSLTSTKWLIQASPVQNKCGPAVMPAECEGKTYCDQKPDNWDCYKAKYEEILKNFDIRAIQNHVIVEDRNGVTENDAICSRIPSDDLVIYMIVDEEGNPLVVVQLEEKQFLQRHKIIQCSVPGEIKDGGNLFDTYFMQTMQINCTQVNVEKRFLVLSATGEEVELATQSGGMPAACALRYARRQRTDQDYNNN